MCAKLVYKDPNIRVLQWHERIPKGVEPYKYKTRRTQRPASLFDRPYTAPEEILTGYVHGERASALEERFARALDFYGMTYRFQYEVHSVYSLPGEEKTLDFLVYEGGIAIPIEIGSAFVHDSPSKREEEAHRVSLINDVLPMLGIMQITDDAWPMGNYVPYDRPYDLADAKLLVADRFISI